jgi:copper ion binding protein
MRKTLSIEGMSCGHCVSHVREALAEIQGLTVIEVDLAEKRAVVEGAAPDEIAMKAAVAEAGYEVVAIA